MKKQETVIRVQNVSKTFKVFSDKGASLKERVLFKKRRQYKERLVLNDLSFDIQKGEAVGLVGENGCGKSTLLKLLSRIMFPDKGTITIDGRVSALIELGAGFHPDMTGRENIYTNAAIFGLTRAEIDERLESIIAFSELGEYIDNPVRTYSSGMYMRLAFSVAINVDADVLLVDEILAVGDAAFQAKCFNRMREIKASGTTIVIVSHSLGQIEQICDRTIWICDGVIRREGAPRDVHPAYLNFMGQKNESAQAVEPLAEESVTPAEQENAPAQEEQIPDAQESVEEATEQDPAAENRWGNGDARITEVKLLDEKGQEKSNFATGEAMYIQMQYRTKNPLRNPACGIGIFRNDGLQCYGTNTQIDRIENVELGKQGIVTCKILGNQLLPGQYSLDVAIHTEDGFAYDYYRYAKTFQMYSETADAGVMRMEHQWQVEKNG